MGIRRERNGWRAYVRVAGTLRAKRFPHDTPRANMDAWIAAQRASPHPSSVEDRQAELWQAYRPKWIQGLLKTPYGWKVQVSVNGRLLQKRFGRRTSVADMLEWRDRQRRAH